MKRLSDYMIISDIDGTLLDCDGKIPQRNIDAIRRFTEKGGRFGIATGRSRGLMREMTDPLTINAPCVLYNGGALYDYESDAMLMELFLPESAPQTVREIMRQAPETGVMVIRDDSYHQIKTELAFAGFYDPDEPETLKNRYLSELNRMPQPWYKVLFLVQEEESDAFLQLARSGHYPGVRFVATNSTLVEMLPEQSSKGFALQQLIDQKLLERENLVAIGDYYNDLEMIALAGLGVTLETSPEPLRAAADLVVGTCANGAVADLIEHLEKHCAE